MAVSIVQPSFTGGEWSPSLFARFDLAKYSSALRTCRNFIIQPHGGVTNRSGTQFVCEVKDSSKQVTLIPFQFSVEQAYVLEFGNQYMRVIMDGGQVLSGASPYEIATPYLEADLPLLKYTQSADVMYLTHPSYAPRKLSRTGHTSWTLTTISFGSGVSAPTGLSRDSGAGTDAEYVVTAVTEDGEESVASSAVVGGVGSEFSWNTVSGAAYYNFYKDASLSGTFGWIGQANDTTFSEFSPGISPDYTRTPPTTSAPFTGSDNYPGVCTFFEQRLLFARTNNAPQTIWGSNIGSFENMNKSSPIQDDDAYNFTINALQVNEIKWMEPLNELIVGTSGTEWKITAGESANAVTPSNVQVKMQSKWGGADVQPLLVGSTVLFVQAAGNLVRDLLYSLEVDGYTGNNLSLMAEHLFKDKQIVNWCFQQSPYSTVWAVRDDGVLLGMTYAREHELWGWHRHDTEGLFENVVSLQTGEAFDEVYFVVNRTIDGSTVRYIERFMPRMPDDDVEQAFFVDCGLSLDSEIDVTGATQAEPVVITTDTAHGLSNGEYVDLRDIGGMVELVQDSGGNDLTYKRYLVANVDTYTFELQDLDGNDIDGTEFTEYTTGGTARKAVATISGLDHLEGEAVAVLANGSVVEDMTVDGGEITLPQLASIVHVGLPFTSELETLEFNINAEGGTLQDRKRNIIEMLVRVENTRNFEFGSQSDRTDEVRFRTDENYGEPITLFTGDKNLSVYSGEEYSARAYLRNTQPVPVTILALIPKIDYGD